MLPGRSAKNFIFHPFFKELCIFQTFAPVKHAAVLSGFYMQLFVFFQLEYTKTDDGSAIVRIFS